MEEALTKICKILNLKRRPNVYIRANIISMLPKDIYKSGGGIHTPRRYRSIIYVTYREKVELAIHTLAHELYHEYQYRNEDFFKNLTYEEKEIQANGFALAFSEMWGYEIEPKELMHIYYSDETKKDTDCNGIPNKVIAYAEYCKDTFHLRKEIDD